MAIVIHRRQMLQSFGAALASSLAPMSSLAQVPADIARQEYWVMKGGVKLFMSRKQLAAPATGGPRPILFFVHGSSNASGTSWDLNVPGKPE